MPPAYSFAGRRHNIIILVKIHQDNEDAQCTVHTATKKCSTNLQFWNNYAAILTNDFLNCASCDSCWSRLSSISMSATGRSTPRSSVTSRCEAEVWACIIWVMTASWSFTSRISAFISVIIVTRTWVAGNTNSISHIQPTLLKTVQMRNISNSHFKPAVLHYILLKQCLKIMRHKFKRTKPLNSIKLLKICIHVPNIFTMNHCYKMLYLKYKSNIAQTESLEYNKIYISP